MRFLLIPIFVSFGVALAQTFPRELKDEQELVGIVRSSESRLLLLTPTLHSKNLANALRAISLERGVTILILTTPNATTDRASLIPALSLLKRNGHSLEVRLLRNVSRTLLIVDDRRMVIGPMVSGIWSGGAQTRLDLEPNTARSEAANFLAQWRRAKPWQLEIKNPQFKGGSK